MTGMFRRASFRWASALALTAAAIGLVTQAPPAQAATTPWRPVFYSTSSGDMYNIVAVSKTDAWASGVLYNGRTPINTPYLKHWNGTSWRAYSIPGASGYLASDIAASSAGNVWVFGMDVNNSLNQQIFRFDGAHWHTISVPQDVQLNSPVVFSATDAWTVGGASCTSVSGQPLKCVTDLWHYDGSTWTAYPVNADITSMAGTNARNLWVTGVTGETQLFGTGAVVAYKWSGTAWVYASMPHPKLNGEPSVGTDSASDVWIGAWNSAGTTAWALHWNGSKWAQITAPTSLAATFAVFPDGHGGVWMGAWAHWTGHAWVSTVSLASPIQGGGIYDVVKIPGMSASYWGAAALTKNSNVVGWHPAIAVYGPLP